MSLVRRPCRRTAALACFILLLLPLAGCRPDVYDVTENLSYDPALDIHGTFDVYEPKCDSVRPSRPAILAIHGGAWSGGDKAWGRQIAEEFTPYGYVIFSINYREGAETHSRECPSIQSGSR
ncbi:MAG: hypothetical protein WEF86_16820, partial [Gemmatimonadota bacterium]